MQDVLRWIDRHNGAPALEILAAQCRRGGHRDRSARRYRRHRLPGAVGHLVHRIGCPGRLSHRGCPGVDAHAAARPRRVLQRPEHSLHLLDGTPTAPIRTARRGGRRRRARCRPTPVPAPGAAARPPCSPSTRSPTSPPSPTCRPWSARAPGRDSWCWPACRTSRRPGRAGAARPTGSSRSSARRSSCRGIADTTTLRDISALAGDRDVAATTISRSVGRWGRIRPSTSVGSTREPRLPVDAVAHGAPGRALVLGPHKEVERGRADAGARALSLARARCRRRAHAGPRSRRTDLEPLSQRPSPRSTPTGSRSPEPCPRGIEVRVSCGRGRRGGPSAATPASGGRGRPERLTASG